MRVIAYAARTGTRRNLAAMRAVGWRLMVSARGVLRHEGFRYALDNGAWTAFAKGEPFDESAFLRAYERLGEGADFVVVPDIVAGGQCSLDFSLRWLDRLDPSRLRLLAVQDGMMVGDVYDLLASDPLLGIFVGGSTTGLNGNWKERTLPEWGRLSAITGCYLHVGRVNTARRIKLCHEAGSHSFDGSSVTRYVDTLPLLEGARAACVPARLWAPR